MRHAAPPGSPAASQPACHLRKGAPSLAITAHPTGHGDPFPSRGHADALTRPFHHLSWPSRTTNNPLLILLPLGEGCAELVGAAGASSGAPRHLAAACAPRLEDYLA